MNSSDRPRQQAAANEPASIDDGVADLDELVRALNTPDGQPAKAMVSTSIGDDGEVARDARSSVEAPSAVPARRQLEHASFSPDPGLEQLLRRVVERGGSDLHVVSGASPFLRVDGELEPMAQAEVSRSTLTEWFERPLTDRQRELLERRGAVDFSIRLEQGQGRPPARFRANVHRQRGEIAASARVLPSGVPSFDGLGLPAALRDLVNPMQGVVLVCGPTGAGKSTTLAAMVDHINRERRSHILTLEDPIEYEHRNRRSLIQQMEVGVDIPSFGDGLRSALRQDPDVILLGEMRDLDSIGTALAAAETGHLLLSTVHTSDPAQAIHRVVDVFPSEAREQIRQLLAGGLEAVVCQRLLPRIGGGRALAVEILRATPPVRHHIRSGGLHKLYNEMVTGQRHGMVTMESALAELVRGGQVTREDALARSHRPDEINSLLGA